jgi:hypothetical protein
MAEQAPDADTKAVNCMIVEDPDGSLYLISEDVLKAHRLPDEVAGPLRAAYARQRDQAAVDGLGAAAASFQILGQGPVVRRRGLTVPTMDTWFDMMRGPQPPTSTRP